MKLFPTFEVAHAVIPQAPPEVKDAVASGAVQHVAIIMDGNRRWAKQNGKLTPQGHYQGYKSLHQILEYCADELNLPVLTVYAFSTENWKRDNDEVSFLFRLMKELLGLEIKRLIDHNVRLRFIGDIDALPEEYRKFLREAEAKTAECTGILFQVAWNYGGRAEILDATRRIAEKVKSGELSPEDINETTFSESLYTAGERDPDIVIRTGGDSRISNFLLWQLAYAEIFIREEFWPEFSPEILNEIILAFRNRQRRYGK